MFNQFSLAGKIKEFCGDHLILEVQSVGRVDYIPIFLTKSKIKRIQEQRKIGDLIGAQGRIEVSYGNIYINTEKITYLSNH